MMSAGGGGEFTRGLVLAAIMGAALLASAVAETYVVVEGIAGGAVYWFIGSMITFQATLITLIVQHLREHSRGVKGVVFTSYFFIIVLAVTAVFSVLTCTPYFPGR